MTIVLKAWAVIFYNLVHFVAAYSQLCRVRYFPLWQLFTLTNVISYYCEVFKNAGKHDSDSARFGWGAAAQKHFET